ncbi:aspartate carbamoyltransferase regulatory subunit [Candidatus Uhrbacteria bacterium]|nr:aspartate carbamoyltransferase regulatory subunit [Candidatus Uhrbacteria bacterium]
MPKTTLSVSAIKEGTVIDHIPAGCASRIISLLHLTSQQKQVTVGFNLPSKSMKRKDLLKVEGREITEQEGNRIAVLAPKATIVIIKNYTIVKKYIAKTPKEIQNVFVCPHPQCITNHEQAETRFAVSTHGIHLSLRCVYCERTYQDSDIREYC